MRKPRLVIFDPNLKSVHGHYLSYAKRIAGAAERRGIGTIVVGNSDSKISSDDPRIISGLTMDYWQEMRPTDGKDPHDHLAMSSNIFADSLDIIIEECRTQSEDVLFFPYANLAEAMGLAHWSRLAVKPLPRTVLLFRRELGEQADDCRLSGRLCAGLLRQALASLYANIGEQKVRLFTDSEYLTEEYTEATRRRFQTAPIPVDERFMQESSRSLRKPLTIVYMGDARTEKGYHLLPKIARELIPELTAGAVHMVLQSNLNIDGGEPGILEARNALSELPNVTLLYEPISDEEYIQRITSADLILLPYEAERYIARTSGILAEAIHAGVPALVPQGTWLSEQILRYGAGVAYDPFNEADIFKSVRAALEDLEIYKKRIQDRRAGFIRFHTPNRLAKFLCGIEVLQAGENHLKLKKDARFSLNAERTVAEDSADHLFPHGTRLDNSKNYAFNNKLFSLYPNRNLQILDLGCSGGAFVSTCLDDGHSAVGLEGSDYSQKLQRAEWGRIGNYLFTCDATHSFSLYSFDTDTEQPVPMKCDVITAWEFIEHIHTKDLSAVCENVLRHLKRDGIWILSVSPNPEIVEGVALHQTVQEKEWWIDFFASHGFTNHPELVEYFGEDWVRGEQQNAPGSFHLILTHGDGVPPHPPVLHAKAGREPS